VTASGSAIESPLVVGGAHRLSGGKQHGAAAPRDAAAPSRAQPIPARAEGVELLGELGGSGYRRTPALVRRDDGQTIQLTPLLYGLLEAIDGERGYAELAATLSERIGKHATAEDVRFLTEAKLRPLGLLQRPDGTAPTVAKPSPLLGLRMKLAVSNPETTRRITAPFAWLFHLWIVVPVLITFALTVWWVAFEKGLGSAAHQALYRPTLMLVVLALTLLSAGFHEVGHAAACRFGGARPGRMGVGLYLVWPAFYTDVTDSYRLSRGGRLRVDLGGLYFNAIFAVAMLGIWTAVHWDPLLLVVAAQPLQMVRQLVPFVRFDGYHILADLVGVPDLFRHIKPTLLGLLPARWGRAEGKTLHAWARAVVTLWVVIVVPLLATLLVVMVVALPRVVATAWDSLGLQSDALEASWAQADVSAVVARLLSMLMIILPVAGTVYLLVRVGRRTARKVVRATAGRPLLRTGTALASAVLLAGLAWAWWPGGSKYQPIGPSDKGRILDLPVAAAEPQVVRAQAAEYTPPTAETESAGVAAVRKPTPTPARAAGHAEWMLVLLPKRPSGSDRPDVRPTVTLPPPVPDGVVAAPSVAPPERQPGSDTGDNSTLVTIVPPEPATGAQSKPGWVFPFDPPPQPRENDNQALAVNTTNGSTTYVVALSLVWVTDGEPVDERNTAYAAASCTDCRTVAVAFQAVFVVGYAQVVTPVNSAVAVNYNCNTCSTNALAIQLAVTLTRSLSESAKREIAAVWAQLQQASKQFELLPLARVYEQLNATRTQLLAILARDGALPHDTTETSVSEDGDSSTTTTTDPTTRTSPEDTTSATTTTSDETGTTTSTTTDETLAGESPTGQTTTGQTTTEQTTTGQTATGQTTTGPTTTTGQTTTEQTTTSQTTTGQTTTGQTTTGETTTTTTQSAAP